MNSRNFVAFLVLMFALIAFSGGFLLGQSAKAPIALFENRPEPSGENPETEETIAEVWNLIHARYYDQPLDDSLLTEGAIDGMLAVLEDPNTQYFTPEVEAAARERLAGEYQGIGIEVDFVEGVIVVVTPIDGSPAAEAGIRPGDILRRANDIDLSGMSLEEVVDLVRGPAGTSVKLAVERYGQISEVEIYRDVIRTASVRGELLDENIAYVRLSRFGERTAEELESTLTTLLVQDPIGLIIDVRRNPGGSLETVVDVVDQFLSDGTILRRRYGNGQEDVFEADDVGLAQDIPLVVLIDEGSASGSEVLAGAIRDSDRGILVGQTTFGKGTIQNWHTLTNGGGLRLTIARWLTPSEQWVHGTGLDPDFFIPLADTGGLGVANGGAGGQDIINEGDSELMDAQLQAAIDLLLGKSVTSILDDGEIGRNR